MVTNNDDNDDDGSDGKGENINMEEKRMSVGEMLIDGYVFSNFECLMFRHSELKIDKHQDDGGANHKYKGGSSKGHDKVMVEDVTKGN